MLDGKGPSKGQGAGGQARGECQGPRAADGLAMLLRGAEALGIPLAPAQGRQLLAYQDHLLDANKHTNLTAIRDAEEALAKHLLDSISPLRVLPADQGATVIDIGSGGGLPGIPLKIMCPQWRVTLLDAADKRVRLLAKIIAALGLRDIAARHGRAEELARQPGFRDSFDIVLARAVAPMAVLVELCLPFVRPGGVMVALKGPALTEELPRAQRAIELLSGSVEVRDGFVLPFIGARRELIRLRKLAPTDQRFPRRPGLPARRPL